MSHMRSPRGRAASLLQGMHCLMALFELMTKRCELSLGREPGVLLLLEAHSSRLAECRLPPGRYGSND